MSQTRSVVLLVALLLTVTLTAATFDPAQYGAMQWREVGPYRGGRSAAVEGIASQPNTYYFGSTGGGVWKTTDGGETWKNVSDGFFGGSIGAVAVSEWDPNVVYVGGGEKTVRGNVSHGDGMWKSTDAGKTWKHVGLDDSRHIPRVRIHPRNPDLVYAAVLGHLFGPNEERGVYRSKDGGKTWERVLFANENAGAVDLVLDPTNPRILYASTWRVRRTPYSLESGGAGLGALEVDRRRRHLEEHLAATRACRRDRSASSASPSRRRNPQNVYAIVEAEEGGVFRSRDGGETWAKTNESRDLRQRAWYYTRIYADPKDEDTVYVVNVRFHKSKDGGKTFTHDRHAARRQPRPLDRARRSAADDRGERRRRQRHHRRRPQLDRRRTTSRPRSSTASPPTTPSPTASSARSRTTAPCASAIARPDGGIGVRDWEPTAGGESGHIVAKPDDPDVVYGGSYGGYLTMVQPPHRRVPRRQSVARQPDGPRRGRSGGALPVELPDPLLAARPEHALRRVAASLQVDRRRRELGGASAPT